MTTFTLQRQIEWTPAQTITACVEILLRTRADLLFSLPPSKEAHVTLSRARREFPEVFDDDISAQLQRWQDNSQPIPDEAEQALITIWTTRHTAVRIGIMSMTGNAPRMPADAATMQMKPSPAPEPFDPTSWMKDVEGDHYAYVPRNPNADMNTDDLVALPWGKRTLYKPAGLMVYFSPEEEERYEYYVANGCYIQGVHRPVQPISRSRAQKLSSGSNVDAARDMSFHRERLLRGAKQELRVFPPWYSRPRTSSLQESAVPDGVYLCRMCKSPLNAATAGPAADACPNGCVRP